MSDFDTKLNEILLAALPPNMQYTSLPNLKIGTPFDANTPIRDRALAAIKAAIVATRPSEDDRAAAKYDGNIEGTQDLEANAYNLALAEWSTALGLPETKS